MASRRPYHATIASNKGPSRERRSGDMKDLNVCCNPHWRQDDYNNSNLNQDFANMQIRAGDGNDSKRSQNIHSNDESRNIVLGVNSFDNHLRSRGRGRGYQKQRCSHGVNHRIASLDYTLLAGDERIKSNEISTEKVQFPTGQERFGYMEKLEAERANQLTSFDYKAAIKESERYQAEFWGHYPKIIKTVYKQHPEVSKWSAQEAEHYRQHANGITVKILSDSENSDYIVPNPIAKFEHAFVNYPNIQKLLINAGFEKPTPIQAQAWPLIMEGRDTIGIAQTGTGKTLAFLLPAYVHILEQEKMPGKLPGANVLILAPTRELAQQIHQEVEKFDYANLKSLCIYGGIDRKKQIRDVSKGCNILIGTPGRLDDLIMGEHIDITTVTFVVLDEADRMLDCGFEPQIRKTMYKIRPDRQTIMTSATWPSGVQRLANSYMKHPVQVVIGSLDLAAVNSVQQQFEFMDNEPEIKLDHLMNFLTLNDNDPDLKVMVFASSKATASYVSSEIGLKEVSCASIRGDMDQLEREYSIEAMKAGQLQFLIATDVASRGIDIPDLTHVINFDFPRDIEEYVHRVGRTGRAGKTGIALTYFTRRDAKHADGLIKILEKANQSVPEQLKEYANNHSRRMKFGDNNRPRRGKYNYNF